MPSNKEFTMMMDDRPGTLGKVCRGLADHKVNIVAIQSLPFVLSAPSELPGERSGLTRNKTAENNP